MDSITKKKKNILKALLESSVSYGMQRKDKQKVVKRIETEAEGKNDGNRVREKETDREDTSVKRVSSIVYRKSMFATPVATMHAMHLFDFMKI